MRSFFERRTKSFSHLMIALCTKFRLTNNQTVSFSQCKKPCFALLLSTLGGEIPLTSLTYTTHIVLHNRKWLFTLSTNCMPFLFHHALQLSDFNVQRMIANGSEGAVFLATCRQPRHPDQTQGVRPEGDVQHFPTNYGHTGENDWSCT